MNPFLDSIQHKITRSLEYASYSKFLEFGLVVDRVAFAGNPTGYKAKQKEIQDRKGFCVEVFGHGSPADRDNKYVPRYVITGLGFFQGSVGNDGIPFFLKNPSGTFDKIVSSLKSASYRFEVELTANKTTQDNVMEAIRPLAIPDLNYIPVYQVPGDSFLVQYGGVRNIPDFTNGLIRKIYTYEILDVFEKLNQTIGQVVPIKQITVTDAEDNSTIVKVTGK